MVPPDDQKLGELIEAVRTVKDGLTEVKDGMVEMRRENADDHSKVIEAMGKLASKKEVKAVEDRTDALESFKDKLWFIVPGITLAGTFVVGLLLHITGGGS
jgi:hypothetical protein